MEMLSSQQTEIFQSVGAYKRWRQALTSGDRDLPLVGFVPTMGALHEGHASLIRRARQECAYVVVSIFVNPLQFGPKEDFGKYPRTLENDVRICNEAGVDAVFHPNVEEIYPR